MRTELHALNRAVNLRRVLFSAGLGLVAGTSLAAQTPRPPKGDSVAIALERQRKDSLDALRDLQARKDRFWRQLGIATRAPIRTPRIQVSFTCEIVIYNYCFGPKNGDVPVGAYGSWPVGSMFADRTVLSNSRKTLHSMTAGFLRDLDALEKRIPRDPTAPGIRVYLLIERDDLLGATAAARACRGDKWWCASLLGHTLFLARKYEQADSAFSVAMANMSEGAVCQWNDVSLLLDNDDARRWFKGLSCAERVAFTERLWWLADPLFFIPGNERRVGHYSRIVHHLLTARWVGSDRGLMAFNGAEDMARVRAEAAGEEYVEGSARRRWSGLPELMDEYRYRDGGVKAWHAAAHFEMVLRMGMPAFSIPATSSGREEQRFLFQFAGPRHHLIPSLDAIHDPLRARPEHWELSPLNPAELYRASFGVLSALDHQVAYFERGDSALLVAVADVRGHLTLARAPLLASALALARNEREPPRVLRQMTGPKYTYSVPASRDSVLMSLEMLTPTVGAARARYAIGPPPMPAQRVRMSDLLLVEPGDSLSSLELEAATARAFGGSTFPRGTAIGVFWELYGASAGDSARYSLSSVPLEGPNTLARILGARPAETGARVRWEETLTSTTSRLGQAVSLDLSGLEPGRHELRLTIEIPGQAPVSVARRITIVGP